MNSSAYGDFSITLEILRSNADSIRALAILSGLEIKDFFHGADLSGLDLSNEDFSGLTFNGAKFIDSNLNGIKYDKGSLNLAILPENFIYLQDEFVFFGHEVELFGKVHMTRFCRFRPGSLDSILEHYALKYKQFAEMTNISTLTLYNARSGKIIKFDTANKIILCLVRLTPDDVSIPVGRFDLNIIPMLQFLRQGANSDLFIISRDEFSLLNIVFQDDFHFEKVYDLSIAQL